MNDFYVKASDGTTVGYKFVIDFFDDPYNIKKGKVNIKFNQPSIEEERKEYIMAVIANDQRSWPFEGLQVEDGFKIGGKTSQDDIIYELSPSNKLLNNYYNQDAFYYIDGNQTSKNPKKVKIPYDKFLEYHPVFFWLDPFNRLLEFRIRPFDIYSKRGYSNNY